MHNLDVSHDVSRTGPVRPPVEHADNVCEQGCAWPCISDFLLCKRGSNQWITHTTEFTRNPKTPVNTSVLPIVVAMAADCLLHVGPVWQVCNHRLHQVDQTMRGGECGGNTHANQRRPERTCHLPQHRLSPPRSGRTRTRTSWLRHPHCRRIRAGLYSTPSRAHRTSWTGR